MLANWRAFHLAERGSASPGRSDVVDALLDDVARPAEVEQRWADIASAYRQDEADPDGWRDYLDELAEWDASGSERDAAAVEEWPEYNK